jgi:hypothetical protein
MKKFALTILAFLSLGFAAQAGPEIYSGKEMKQVVPPPCPEWYRDTEWNVSLWGTYVFTAEDWGDDRYIEADHAWGGGMDVKYFFHRYFGIGLEGWGVEAQRERLVGLERGGNGFIEVTDHDSRIVGAVKGTITFRYPFHCSRFSPYIYGGAGAIFGGGERDFVSLPTAATSGAVQVISITARHDDGNPEFLGQIGAGLEYRLTPHIGLINDFSWNFIAKDNSDFGMIRGGINFAF